MTLQLLIQYLLVALLLVGIVALIRLWSLLGVVRELAANLETTRVEATETLRRLDITVTTTEQMLREEVVPTLQAARATLIHVEATTRALADTTSALRRITGRAESATGATRLLAAGGALAQTMLRRNGNQKSDSETRPRASGRGMLLSMANQVGAAALGLFKRK